MDKLLFWLGLGAAQKGAGSKPIKPRHWIASFVVGILIAVLIGVGGHHSQPMSYWDRAPEDFAHLASGAHTLSVAVAPTSQPRAAHSARILERHDPPSCRLQLRSLGPSGAFGPGLLFV
jgi:hypothetical protein